MKMKKQMEKSEAVERFFRSLNPFDSRIDLTKPSKTEEMLSNSIGRQL